MLNGSSFSIQYADEGVIRSGDVDCFCLVYREAPNFFYFYGITVRTEDGRLVRREFEIPKNLGTIEDRSVRCMILKRVSDYAKNCEFSLARNTSTKALDAEILALERAA